MIVLDIDATVNKAEPGYRLIANLAAECRMPLCYGGGVRTPDQAKKIIALGVEKVAISAVAIEVANLVTRIAEAVGRQSVVVVLDVRKKTGLFTKGYEVYSRNGKQAHKLDQFELAQRFQQAAAGEIVVNSIDHDAQMRGYNLPLAAKMRQELRIPLTLLGGASTHRDIEALIDR